MSTDAFVFVRFQFFSFESASRSRKVFVIEGSIFDCVFPNLKSRSLFRLIFFPKMYFQNRSPFFMAKFVCSK